MSPLTACVGRNLVGFGDVSIIAAGGTAVDLYGRSSKRRHRNDQWAYTADARAMTVEYSPVGPGRVTWADLTDLITAGLTPERRARVAAVVDADLSRAGRPIRLGRRRAAHLGGTPEQMIRRRAVTVEVIEAGIAAIGIYEQPSFDDLGGVA
jgi:hypothetical protein